MDFPAPDPIFTRSEQTRAHFRLAVKITLGFLALIWLIHLIGWGLDMGPEQFGIRPRQLAGLPGIVFAPLMHGSFAHLIANSPPLLVSGTAMLFLYPHSSLRAVPAIYFGAGVIVWLAGRGSVHLGASGLVYGDRRLARRCLHVRLAGLGCVADAARSVVGNSPGRGDDRRHVSNRLAPSGCSTAEALCLGRRGQRKRGTNE